MARCFARTVPVRSLEANSKGQSIRSSQLDGQGGSSITSYLTEEVDTLGESSEPRRIKAAIASVDEPEMKTKVAKVLNRLPACGLAVGVIRNGSFEWFYGHGVSDRE